MFSYSEQINIAYIDKVTEFANQSKNVKDLFSGSEIGNNIGKYALKIENYSETINKYYYDPNSKLAFFINSNRNLVIYD